jgi:hypothetical protein
MSEDETPPPGNPNQPMADPSLAGSVGSQPYPPGQEPQASGETAGMRRGVVG